MVATYLETMLNHAQRTIGCRAKLCTLFNLPRTKFSLAVLIRVNPGENLVRGLQKSA